MKIKVPSYFKEFKCIASQCEDTCCAGWDIVVDEEAFNYYKMLDGAFGGMVKSKMVVDQDGDTIFKRENENCPFLDDDKLCNIYKEVGHEGLCYTCRQYPRYQEEFEGLREMGISLSCPEAARMILKQDKIVFEIIQDDEIAVEDDRIDLKHFEMMYDCRAFMLKIIEDREIPLNRRLAILLKCVEALQEKIDFDEMNEIEEILKTYAEEDFIETFVVQCNQVKLTEGDRAKVIRTCFTAYKELEHIHPNDPLALETAINILKLDEVTLEKVYNMNEQFNAVVDHAQDKLTNIASYFIFRYFMKGIFDYDFSAKIKFVCVSTLMIKQLVVVRWVQKGTLTESDWVQISQGYSKDIEHLEQNIEVLEEMFEAEVEYHTDKLIDIILHLV